MLKEAVNELVAHLDIAITSPLLVKDGRIDDDARKDIKARLLNDGLREDDCKALANSVPISQHPLEAVKQALEKQVRTLAQGHGSKDDPLADVKRLRFFVPGSSLRGAWRGHLETLLRSVHGQENPRVCDPLEDVDPVWRSCSKELEQGRGRLGKPYSHSCPICRLFGNTEQGGRIWIGDGVFVDKAVPSVGQRDHVAIDRKSGGPSPQKLFRDIVLEGGRFQVEVRIRNFELFHIFLLATLVQELRDGWVGLGSGKSKGYGRNMLYEGVDSRNGLTLVCYQMQEPDEKWRGIGEHANRGRALRELYGIHEWQSLPALPPGEWKARTPWKYERVVESGLAALASFEESVRQQAMLVLNGHKPLKDRVPAPVETVASEAEFQQ